ncbi:MAG TPA: hypothetical protein DDZ80_05105 [Cyanobacteria bacterium UBA8803]|nr:hypothetical protein [Cyanobacteria bacterium UBA9273]HBL57925.1 hypothetical protein [Cyanobacteria bacterium UBA8803]
MPAPVTIQPQGFSVQYPKTPWLVIFIQDVRGRFRFILSGQDLQFEPRDRYRYPTQDDARRAALCFLELMKRLERSRMRLGILAEVGILKFPQEVYRSYQLWLLIDRTRYSWEVLGADGVCIRAERWYKRPETALNKAKDHIDWENAKDQIRDIIGWV